MKWENDTLAFVLRMRQMVYSSKDINDVDFCRDSAKHVSMMAFAAPKVESLWFLRPVGSKRAELERLTKAEGLPKNISIEELTFPTAVELNLQHKSTEFFANKVFVVVDHRY